LSGQDSQGLEDI